MVSLRHLALQVEPVHVRKLHVENQAGRYIRLGVRVEFGTCAKRDRAQVGGRQERAQRFTDATIVIHDKYDVVLRIRVHGVTRLPAMALLETVGSTIVAFYWVWPYTKVLGDT